MDLLGAAGRRSEALHVYQTVKEHLWRELEVAPSAIVESARAALLPDRARSSAPPPRSVQVRTLTVLTVLCAASGRSRGMQAPWGRIDALCAAAARDDAEMLIAEDGRRLLLCTSAARGLGAAQALQAALLRDAPSLPVSLALHSGEIMYGEQGYAGSALDHGALLCAAAHPGQILVSEETEALARRAPGSDLTFQPLGAYQLSADRRPEHLFQLIHPTLPRDFPPLRAMRARMAQLATPRTAFFGRQSLLAELRSLLAGACGPSMSRLVTLAGPGGCGKTRLALEVATALQGRYVDGARVVELASVTDPDLLAATLAAALGIDGRAGASPLEVLLSVLQTRQLLLVFDNCEHLRDACARMAAAVLDRCPSVHILATSREPLALSGEAVRQVPPLEVPGADEDLPIEEVAQAEAVQLFLDRARLKQGRFDLTEETAPLVAKICRRLDGIPLAIELAASLLPTLSLRRVLAGLQDRFRLLVGDDATELPHHRTLHATLQWSYALLSPAAQQFLRRLAIFNGGWTLEDAEAVLGAHRRIPAHQVQALLAELTRKSLVQATPFDAGDCWYTMLETVRAFAHAQPMSGHARAALADRHQAYYLHLAEQAAAARTSAALPRWLGLLDREYDNLLDALAWRGDGDAGRCAAYRLARALTWFWDLRGRVPEGTILLERLLAAGACSSALLHAWLLTSLGGLAAQQGAYARAVELYQAALAQFRELDDRAGIAAAHAGLGDAAMYHGDLAQALAAHQASLALYRGLNDPAGSATALDGLATVAMFQGEYERAATLHDECLGIARATGNLICMGSAINGMALTASRRGDHAQAAARFRESLALQARFGDRYGMTFNLQGLGQVAIRMGRHADGAWLLGALAALRGRIAVPIQPVFQAEHARAVAMAGAALGDEAFAAAWHAGCAAPLERALGVVLGTIPRPPAGD